MYCNNLRKQLLFILPLVIIWGCSGPSRLKTVSKYSTLQNSNLYEFTKNLEYRYTEAFREEGLGYCDTSMILGSYTIIWKPFPFFKMGPVPNEPNATYIVGQISYEDKILYVGYKPRLEDTALGHELGHMWLGECYDKKTEDDLKTFTRKYNLPYKVTLENN